MFREKAANLLWQPLVDAHLVENVTARSWNDEIHVEQAISADGTHYFLHFNGGWWQTLFYLKDVTDRWYQKLCSPLVTVVVGGASS